MAVARFIAPFTSYCGTDSVRVQADTLGALCRHLAQRYGARMNVLLDSEGGIAQDIVIMVDRRNAHSLSGAATVLKEETEVLIMPLMAGG